MSVEYDFKVCPICGIHYAMDKTVSDYKKHCVSSDKDRGWYCPNGHSLVYRDSDADVFRRERDQARQQLARAEDEKREAERRAESAERREKRLKKRASAGTCPCCHRTFANMATHLKREHPTFVAEQGAKVVPIKERSA